MMLTNIAIMMYCIKIQVPWTFLELSLWCHTVFNVTKAMGSTDSIKERVRKEWL